MRFVSSIANFKTQRCPDFYILEQKVSTTFSFLQSKIGNSSKRDERDENLLKKLKVEN